MTEFEEYLREIGHEDLIPETVQGILQSLFIRLPISYLMSIQENPSPTAIGAAAPCATIVGIILCVLYYFKVRKNFIEKTD